MEALTHPHVSAVQTAQREVMEVALELTRLDHRLFEITQILPLPADLDSMVEHTVPHNVAAHLDGILRCVKQDVLQDAIATLGTVAQATDADLRQEAQSLAEQRALRRIAGAFKETLASESPDGGEGSDDDTDREKS